MYEKTSIANKSVKKVIKFSPISPLVVDSICTRPFVAVTISPLGFRHSIVTPLSPLHVTICELFTKRTTSGVDGLIIKLSLTAAMIVADD